MKEWLKRIGCIAFVATVMAVGLGEWWVGALVVIVMVTIFAVHDAWFSEDQARKRHPEGCPCGLSTGELGKR